ncbi:unnamed protein product [Vicia faba]|uniref:Uncharacterized protein n=1 Tax=Vicia faba TaxID=3906 RepID=A0AAV1A0B7_VICFA|nr:unnamed protein product [Vicia faba]CAI8599627.1 unnamed protein product [Vicia faba]CAI8601652.1 unnamed protein product [Vicia faba]CAI8604888.1 unnamed protein product [Vicia faba]
MSQRVVSESVSDEDTAAAAEAVVVLRNSLLEIVDIENCPPKRKNREFTRSRLPKSLTVKVSHPILIISLKRKTTTETGTQRPPTGAWTNIERKCNFWNSSLKEKKEEMERSIPRA